MHALGAVVACRKTVRCSPASLKLIKACGATRLIRGVIGHNACNEVQVGIAISDIELHFAQQPSPPSVAAHLCVSISYMQPNISGGLVRQQRATTSCYALLLDSSMQYSVEKYNLLHASQSARHISRLNVLKYPRGR